MSEREDQETHTGHVGRGALLAYVDGELDDGAVDGVARHVAGCDACTRALRGIRATDDAVRDALDRLADPPLRMTAAREAVRRRTGHRTGARGGGVRRALPRAAVIVLALTAGASAAVVPDSPLRRWLGERLQAPEPPANPEPVVAERRTSDSPSAPPPAPAPVSGVSVIPDDGRVHVAVGDVESGSELHVRHAVATDISLLVEGATDSVGFRTAPGRIRVSGAGDARITVVLPRSLSRASVEVNGRRYLVKDGAEITPREPPMVHADTLIVFRVRG